MQRTSPVGVFVEGDTPEGVSDLTGNVFEWTSSLFGRHDDEPEFGYPYVPATGGRMPMREPTCAGVARRLLAQRITRNRTTGRGDRRPDFRDGMLGFRVAVSTA